MALSFSRVSSGALLLALAYNAQPVKADFWEDVDNCELVLKDLPADLTTDFCNDWTYGYQPDEEYTTVTGYPVTITEYPEAKTCNDGGYQTTTKEDYGTSKPTDVPDETTKVPDESTKVPDESTEVPGETTKAPDQPPPTDVPEGGWDVTVTSTTWTTYWTTSTIYPDSYPTPAPYRRQSRELNERASWCVDRPCRLVQYDDNTIFEACKKYLGWAPVTKTVNVPGYTVTETSYPTDCKKKDDGYKPDPVPVYPPEKEDGYVADPYPTEPPKDSYPTEAPEYPEYPTETPEYQPYPDEEPDYQSYPTEAPASYPENDGSYDNGPGYDDGSYNDDSAPWGNDGNYDSPGSSSFDNNYSGPDGPKPWDDADQTQELADAIDAGGYDMATNELGLDDAPWNAQPADYPDNSGGDYKRRSADYSPDNSYKGEDGVDYGSYDPYQTEAPPAYPEDSYKPQEDSYAPTEDSYKPDAPPEINYPSYPVDDSYSSAPVDDCDDKYEGDEHKSESYPQADGAPDYSSSSYWGEDSADY